MDKIIVTIKYANRSLIVSSTDSRFFERYDQYILMPLESLYSNMEQIMYWADSIGAECIFKVLKDE